MSLTTPRYSAGMTEHATPAVATDSLELVLRGELAGSDALIGTIPPILRHLLLNDDHSMFGDEIVARVRGMLDDLALQLSGALAAAIGDADLAIPTDAHRAEIVGALVDVPGLLPHVHGLALEWQLSERLQSRLALDPVVSPLLQALIASPDASTAGLAMNFLAAQARFGQAQRRMRLGFDELPADLAHGVLQAWARLPSPFDEATAAAGEASLRHGHDESRSRLGLAARLITGMGGGVLAALSLSHSGAALFVSALSIATGQDRDRVVLATNENHLARLTLSLRAAGLKPAAVTEQILLLHPEAQPYDNLDQLGADHAAALLALSGTGPGG